MEATRVYRRDMCSAKAYAMRALDDKQNEMY